LARIANNSGEIGGDVRPGGAVDEFGYLHQVDVATLIDGALFMMLWVGGIVAIDYWVGARRSVSGPARDGDPT
jgi:hypothetical protein